MCDDKRWPFDHAYGERKWKVRLVEIVKPLEPELPHRAERLVDVTFAL